MARLCRGLFYVACISFAIIPTAGFAEPRPKPVSPQAITVPINDLVLVRSTGLWTYRNKTTLQRIFPASPASVAVGDLNGDGKHDIIFAVTAPAPAAQRGTWTRTGLAAPQRIDLRGGVRVAAGDFDGNGQADVIAVFQGVNGAHLRMNNGSFFKVHNATPNAVAAGDMDGDGYDDVVISLPTGIFTCYNAQAPWVRLSPVPAQNMALGDLDGDGKADLIVDRGPQGLWKRMNNAGPFVRINTGDPLLINVADPDGNDRDGVLAAFPNGLFFSTNGGSNFVRINPNRPLDVTVGDFNNDGNDDVVALFPGSQVQIRQNNAGPWAPFPGLAANGITRVLAAGVD